MADNTYSDIPEGFSVSNGPVYSDIPEGFSVDAQASQSPSMINGIGRAFATGVPVIGGLLDKADAATNAALAPLLNPLFSTDQQLKGDTFGERYQNAVAEQKGMDAAFSQEHPITSEASNIAGGLAGTVGAVVAAPAAFGIGAGSLPMRMGMSALTGAGMNAADTATRGGDLSDVGRSFGTGSILGGGAPLVGGLVGGVASRIGQRLSGITGAQSILARALVDDSVLPSEVFSHLRDLGDVGMVADLGPNLQRQAGALAAMPGEAQQAVRSAMMDRAQNAGERVMGAADQAMGYPIDTLSAVDNIIQQRAAAAAPLYEKAYAQTMPPSPMVDSVLNTPAGSAAWAKAQTLAANEGQSIDRSAPSVQSLDLTKRALDDQISSLQRQGSANEARIVTNLRNRLVGAVDKAVPDYAAAREAYSGPSSIIDAMDQGSQVFSNKVTPAILNKQLANMDQGQQEAFQQGARGALADIMGTARNDAAGARALFNKGFNREKLNILIGKDAANGLLNTLQSEARFGGTNQIVSGNSETLARQQAVKELGGESQGEQPAGVFRSILNLKPGDALAAALGKGKTALADAALQKRNSDLAQLLTSTAGGNGPLGPALIAIDKATRFGQISDRQARLLSRALVQKFSQGASAEVPRLLGNQKN